MLSNNKNHGWNRFTTTAAAVADGEDFSCSSAAAADVDGLTRSGVSLAEAPAFLKAPGGAPANMAIAVSRLGGKSAFLGKLGDDEFGHMLAGILKEEMMKLKSGGDLSNSDCQDCVSKIPPLSQKLCGGDVVAARIQLEGCYLRLAC